MEEGRIAYKIVFKIPDTEYKPDVRNMAWPWDGRKHTPWDLRNSIAKILIRDCRRVSVLHEDGIYEFSAVNEEMSLVCNIMFFCRLNNWLHTAGKSLGIWSDEVKEVPEDLSDEFIAWACGKLGCDLTVDGDLKSPLPDNEVYKGKWNHKGEVVEPFWPDDL